MERLQGPIDSCFLDDHLAVECLQHGLLTDINLRFEREEQAQEDEEEEIQLSAADLEDKMPLLQMLQCLEQQQQPQPPFFSLKDPNFQPFLKTQTQLLEPESCVTHEATDQNPLSASNSCIEATTNQEMVSHFLEPSPGNSGIIKERKKRKRTRAPKNKEEVESQRMTHIAVERNRRRQMNEHLNSLCTLMPSSYVQRGDQASIIGGAIDFVKELEHLLHSLEAEKRIKMLRNEEETKENKEMSSSSLSSVSSDGFLGEERSLISGGERPEIEVTVIQNHVNLKVRCRRRQGQLVRAVVSMEELGLTVLHLNVASSQDLVFYSFNLKMEDDCRLRSTDEIASTVHQIFNCINGG